MEAWRRGETERNMRCGVIAATIRNAQRTKQSQKVWEWTDFFRDPDAKPKEAQEPERILAGFERISEIINEERAARNA